MGLSHKMVIDSSIELWKTWLIAKGFLQQSGIDFEETFSLVVWPTTMHMVITYAVTLQWTVRQYDVQNAFIHGPLYETMFMTQPIGFTHTQFSSHVCKMHKASMAFANHSVPGIPD